MSCSNRTCRITWALAAIITLTWIAGLWLYPPGYASRAIIHEFFYLTGTLAWALMAVALVIAAWPAAVVRLAGVSYKDLWQGHQSIGIAAFVLTIVHALGKTIGPWIVDLLSALGAAPAQLPKPSFDPNALEGFEYLWSIIRSPAEVSGLWLTGLLIVLAAAALFRKLPRNAWLRLHQILPIAFLALTLHSVRLMDGTDFLSPFGWINLAATFVGAWASIAILSRILTNHRTIDASAKPAGD